MGWRLRCWRWIQKHPYLSLFLFSLSTRVGIVFLTRHQPYSFLTDQMGYIEIARMMLLGNGMEGIVHRTPLFPAYLATHFWIFGEELGIFVAKLTQAFFSSLIPLVLVLFGKQLFSTSVGWIAGLLSLGYPFFSIYPAFLLTESNFVFFFLCWMYLFYLFLQTGRYSWVLGILCGFNTLYRPSNLYFLPFLFILLIVFFPRRCWERKKGFVLLFFFYAITLSPWIYRNYKITQHFVPGTVHLGWLLYVGNSEWADGSAVDSLIREEEFVKAMPFYERDRYYFKQAVSWIQQNPGEFFQLMGVKWYRTWNIVPNFASLKTFWVQWICILTIGPIFFFGVLGILRTPKGLAWCLLLSPIVYYTLIHMITIGSIRYRLPAMPYLILFAATQIDWLWTRCFSQKDA